jgi:hypothetical protein
MTYGKLGQSGHHHVNCNTDEYWIQQLDKIGMQFLKEKSLYLRSIALEDAIRYNPQYMDNHFLNTGMFFKNTNIK